MSGDSNLIRFDLMRKTEHPDSMVRHGAYNFHPKHLRRIKMLLFKQRLELADSDEFKHVPYLKQIYLEAGVDGQNTLQRMATHLPQLQFMRLTGLTSSNASSLQALDAFSSLTLLDLETNLKIVHISLPRLTDLWLKCNNETDSIDLTASRGLIHLQIYLDRPDALRKLKVPPGLETMNINGYNSLLSQKFAFKAFETDKNVPSTLRLQGWDLTEQDAPLPQVTKLTLGPNFSKNELLPVLFPNITSLDIDQPHGNGLVTAIKALPHLENILLMNCENLDDATLNAIIEKRPDISMQATRNGTQQFTMEVFEAGIWRTETIR